MLNILIALISLAVLIKSTDIFIDQSTALAKKIKVSGFFIGFTLVALGTSLPDLTISTYSAATGNPGIAISTFLGAVIIKTSLLLGILALFSKYKLDEIDVRRNIPINTVIYIGIFLLLWLFNFQMHWYLGIATICMLVIAIFLANKNNHKIRINHDTKFSIIFLLLSFLLVIISGKFTVDYITIFADEFGIAQTTIGYFVLAMGTTTPELITSLTAIKKGNINISLGNMLGACLIDILFVSGITSFFATLDFNPFKEELLFLIFATFVTFLFAILGKKHYISKREGLGLILVYILFILIQTL
jgi:cation:H+ antiporter